MKDKNRYLVVVILQSIIILLLTLNVYNLYKVGIKQKGIDNLILKEITQDTYDKITLFMSESEEEYYESIYKYNKKDNTYKLDKYKKEDLLEIEYKVLPKYYLYYDALQNNSNYDSVLGVKDYTNIYNNLNSLSNKQRANYLKPINKQLKKYNKDEIEDLTYKALQVEYKKLGNDINKLKSDYILKTIVRIVLYLVLLLLLNNLNIKLQKEEYKYIDNRQTVILFILSIILLYNLKLIPSIILTVIYLIITGIIIFINKLRRNNKEFNKELSNIEDMISFKEVLRKDYKIRWFYFILITFVINISIYYGYTTYHILVGKDPVELVNNILFIFGLIFNILLVRNIIFIVMQHCINNRPKVIEKKPIVLNDHKEKKKNKKKKKKK